MLPPWIGLVLSVSAEYLYERNLTIVIRNFTLKQAWCEWLLHWPIHFEMWIISFSILCQLRFLGPIEGICPDGKWSLWRKYSRWRLYPITDFYSISWTNKELNIAEKRSNWDRKSIVILDFFQYVVLSSIWFLLSQQISCNEYPKQGID